MLRGCSSFRESSRAGDHFSHSPWREVIGLRICRPALSTAMLCKVVCELGNNYARTASKAFIVHIGGMPQMKSKRLPGAPRSSNLDLRGREIYR